jgi:ATP-dependent protease Clp ATPase subunit
MDHTDYSSIACAYITSRQEFIIIDDQGGVYLHPEKDPLKQEDMLEQMELQGGFASFESDWVFNPQYVTEAFYNHKSHYIELSGGQDKLWKQGSKMAPQAAEKKLGKLERYGFIPWPGGRMFNREFVDDMYYDDEDNVLVMDDCHGIVYEANISREKANYFLNAFKTSYQKRMNTEVQLVPQTAPEQKPAEEPATGLDKQALRTLAQRLKSVVIGQDPAADELTAALYHNAAGLGEPNKPIGSFLFLGPTGVGKTEISKQLAEAMGMPFKRFDMSEYQEKHNSSRLIGAPPGYIGYDKGGDLTNFMSKEAKGRPCVILLDEIEKAHPDVPKILLQAFDAAKMTDGQNNTVDFTNAVFIMTSNLSAQPNLPKKKMASIGFNAAMTADDADESDPRSDPAVRAYFPMELINRMDSIIRFQSLKPEHMKEIIKITLKQMVNKPGLVAKNILFSIAPEAEDYLATKGYDPEFGARPLKRLIANEIEKKLAPELLFGVLEKGGSVNVGLRQDKKGLDLVFNASANDNKPKAQTAAILRLPSPSVA